MRWPLLDLTIVFYLLANQGSAQDSIHSIQSTNRADSNLIESISSKLDEPSPIKGSDRALPLKQLVSMYPIVVLLDEKALDEENLTVEEPITVPNVKGISIRNQLKYILEPLQLTYVVKPGYVVVTSKKTSANVVRLYDVTSFVSSTRGKFNFTPLVNIIERSIADDQWQSAGGNSSMTEWPTPKAAILVVTAPDETHDAIRDLFSAQSELLKRSNSGSTSRRLHSTELRASNVRRSWLR